MSGMGRRYVVKTIIEKYGKLDILVNNAGIFSRIKKLHEIEDEEWNRVLDVNLTGSFRFSKECIPYLTKTSGTIVNIASDAGLRHTKDLTSMHIRLQKQPF